MKIETRQQIIRSLFAGFMIAVGCTVYLSCSNKIVGSVLFSSGLFFILSQGGVLFTGVCGLKTPWKTMGLVLLFNALGGLVCGALTWPSGKLAETAAALMLGKLGANPLSWLTNGVLCGVMMYLAVMGYKQGKDTAHGLAGVLYAVPVFIISAFEHSIADLGYLALAIPALGAMEILQCLGLILVVVIGNIIGGKLARYVLVDWQK